MAIKEYTMTDSFAETEIIKFNGGSFIVQANQDTWNGETLIVETSLVEEDFITALEITDNIFNNAIQIKSPCYIKASVSGASGSTSIKLRINV